MRLRVLATLALTLLLSSTASAQTTTASRQRLPFDRPESWGMAWAAAVLEFTALEAGTRLTPGEVELAVEAASIPSLSADERRIGFNGTKVEDIQRAPAFGRFRVRLGLPHAVVAEIGVVPPVDLDGLEPRLLAAAVARPLGAVGRAEFVARLVAQHAILRGDITCSRDDVAGGDDSSRNPFGCEVPSRDELELTTFGLELGVSMPLTRRRPVDAYFSAGLRHLTGDFRVDAHYQGLRDHTRLSTSGWLWSVVAGMAGDLAPRWRLAGEAVYSPLEIRRPGRGVASDPAVNFRLALARRLR